MFSKSKLLLIITSLFFIINLYAKGFEAIIEIKEVNNKKIALYEKKEKVVFENNSLNKDLKYNNALSLILDRVMILEKSYKNTDLYIVESVIDGEGMRWTISSTITSKDISVTQFISSQDDITISGWINRNNKDIFGLRILNF